MAAVHAHVPELEARLAQLQAELAPLLKRHQTLSNQLPWKQQLVRSLTCCAANSWQIKQPQGADPQYNI